MAAHRSSDLSEEKRVRVSARRTPIILLLNVIVVLLLFVVGYLSYTFFSQAHEAPADEVTARQPGNARVLQLDVLNGCGVKGVSVKFTGYLRAHDFDVVDIRNYRSSHMSRTLVVDRVGNLEAARRVALALGVDREHIVQQLNPDYFVDVSVIIGEDYARLSPSH